MSTAEPLTLIEDVAQKPAPQSADAKVLLALLQRHYINPKDPEPGGAFLTEVAHLRRRERVAELVADGLEPKAIAAELGVSLHTVHDDCCRMGLTRGRTVRALRSA